MAESWFLDFVPALIVLITSQSNDLVTDWSVVRFMGNYQKHVVKGPCVCICNFSFVIIIAFKMALLIAM